MSVTVIIFCGIIAPFLVLITFLLRYKYIISSRFYWQAQDLQRELQKKEAAIKQLAADLQRKEADFSLREANFFLREAEFIMKESAFMEKEREFERTYTSMERVIIVQERTIEQIRKKIDGGEDNLLQFPSL